MAYSNPERMQYSRLLMRASVVFLGLLGLAATFMADVILAALEIPASPLLQLMIQLLGALYLGFAVLNWMTRDNLIGGIYGRPLVVGNLMHFFIAGITIMRQAPEIPALWPAALLFVLFAAGFAVVMFRHPARVSG